MGDCDTVDKDCVYSGRRETVEEKSEALSIIAVETGQDEVRTESNVHVAIESVDFVGETETTRFSSVQSDENWKILD